MTDAKDVAKAIGAGGKFILDVYFDLCDAKEAENPTRPATPSFAEVMIAAGSKLPSIEDALNGLMHPTATPATPATPSPSPTTPPATPMLADVEARIRQADAVIEARMAALQQRMQGLEGALRALAQLLPPGPPLPAQDTATLPAEPPAPPEVVVLLEARESRHHQLLAEGEEALGTLEGLVEVIASRVEASTVVANAGST